MNFPHTSALALVLTLPMSILAAVCPPAFTGPGVCAYLDSKGDSDLVVFEIQLKRGPDTTDLADVKGRLASGKASVFSSYQLMDSTGQKYVPASDPMEFKFPNVAMKKTTAMILANEYYVDSVRYKSSSAAIRPFSKSRGDLAGRLAHRGAEFNANGKAIGSKTQAANVVFRKPKVDVR